MLPILFCIFGIMTIVSWVVFYITYFIYNIRMERARWNDPEEKIRDARDAINDPAGTVCCAGVTFGGITLIAWVVLLLYVETNLSPIQQKIELYTEQNADFEDHVDSIMAEYMGYDAETYQAYKESTGEDGVTLAMAYSDLVSDELTKSQIDSYLANNNELFSLKEQSIKYESYNWLIDIDTFISKLQRK